jgi:AraC family transcriptional regulator
VPRPATLDDYTLRISRVTAHIEQHLDQECSLAELASVAAFSPCHFHRVFRAVTGEGVAAHVRRLRLERAARQLRLSGRPVVDIALEAGYQAHESFTRAFLAAYGVAPSHWRAGGPSPDLPQVEPVVERIGPLRIVRLRHVGPYAAVGETFQRLGAWVGSRGLFGPWTRGLGICHDDPEVTGAAHLRYDAAFTVPRPVPTSDQVEFVELPARDYIKTRHRGPYAGLPISYAALIRGWMRTGSRPLADNASIEFYLNAPGNTPPENLLTDICLPLD